MSAQKCLETYWMPHVYAQTEPILGNEAHKVLRSPNIGQKTRPAGSLQKKKKKRKRKKGEKREPAE